MNLPYSIRKLKHRPGSLYVDFRFGGRRHCISLETTDKHIARLRADEVYKRSAAGQMQHSGRVTVDQFLAEYRAWSSTQKSKRTLESEETALRRWQAVILKKYVADINEKDVDAFITQLAGAGAEYRFRNGKIAPRGSVLSAVTVRTYVRSLSAVFRMAKRWKYITHNPFHDAPLPAIERPMPRTYTLDEMRRILAAAAEHSPECLDIFIMYFVTGMRVSEAFRLEWQDVDFERGLIQLRRTKARKVRFVPMGPIARRVLISRRSNEKPFDGFIRTYTDGRKRLRRFDVFYVGREFKRVAVLAGIKNAKLKLTRGTYATALLEVAHLSPLAVQSIVGHADIRTTQQHYYNPLSETVLEKSGIIDAEFEQVLPQKLKQLWITSG